MSFTDLRNKFIEELNQFTIDHFYVDEGPDFIELFLSILSKNDLVVHEEYSNEKKVFSIKEVKSDVHTFFYEKSIDLSRINNKYDDNLNQLKSNIEYDFYFDKKINKTKEQQKALIENEIKDTKQQYVIFKEELSSFLFLAFLTTNKIIDLRIDNYEIYKEVETIDKKDDYDGLLNYVLVRKNMIPDKWREIIKDSFNNLKHISGELKRRTDGKKNYKLYWNKIKMSPIDIQFVLSITHAVNHHHHQIVNDNNIAIYLGGGIMALLSFRKKPTILNKYQEKGIELFKVEFKNQYLKSNSLFSISGTSSTLKVNSPFKYYLLTDNYVIEIDFEAAPMLMDNSQMMQTISSNKKEINNIIYEQNELDD